MSYARLTLSLRGTSVPFQLRNPLYSRKTTQVPRRPHSGENLALIQPEDPRKLLPQRTFVPFQPRDLFYSRKTMWVPRQPLSRRNPQAAPLDSARGPPKLLPHRTSVPFQSRDLFFSRKTTLVPCRPPSRRNPQDGSPNWMAPSGPLNLLQQSTAGTLKPRDHLYSRKPTHVPHRPHTGKNLQAGPLNSARGPLNILLRRTSLVFQSMHPQGVDGFFLSRSFKLMAPRGTPPVNLLGRKTQKTTHGPTRGESPAANPLNSAVGPSWAC